MLGDIYARLTAPPVETFDLILIDVDYAPDDPLSEANRYFYTVEGFEGVRGHLAPGGILGVWSSGSDLGHASEGGVDPS